MCSRPALLWIPLSILEQLSLPCKLEFLSRFRFTVCITLPRYRNVEWGKANKRNAQNIRRRSATRVRVSKGDFQNRGNSPIPDDFRIEEGYSSSLSPCILSRTFSHSFSPFVSPFFHSFYLFLIFFLSFFLSPSLPLPLRAPNIYIHTYIDTYMHARNTQIHKHVRTHARFLAPSLPLAFTLSFFLLTLPSQSAALSHVYYFFLF